MGIESLAEFRDWLATAPEGTTLEASAVAEKLDALEDAEEAPDTPELPEIPFDLTWAERLWLVPSERRLGTREVLEALGKSRSWLYTAMAEDKGRNRLPHRKLDGELVFTAGEIRAWLRDHEDVIAAGPMESTAAERRLQILEGGAR